LFKKILSIVLSGMLLSAAFGFQAVRAQTTNAGSLSVQPQLGAGDTQAIEKTRAKVQKLGIGRDARVEVKLRDNTRVKGYVSASSQDSFTVTDRKTGASQTIAFANAAEVKKQGGGLSTRSWIIIGGVAAAAAIVALTVIKPVLCDGGAGC
jgi:hypothetical protein